MVRQLGDDATLKSLLGYTTGMFSNTHTCLQLRKYYLAIIRSF